MFDCSRLEWRRWRHFQVISSLVYTNTAHRPLSTLLTLPSSVTRTDEISTLGKISLITTSPPSDPPSRELVCDWSGLCDPDSQRLLHLLALVVRTETGKPGETILRISPDNHQQHRLASRHSLIISSTISRYHTHTAGIVLNPS